MTTGAAVVNEALSLIDSQSFVTGSYPNFTDGTTQNVVGTAANTVYALARDMLLRQINPEFARVTAVLSAAPSSVTPIPPWAYEYLYPSDCLRARQVRPPSSGVGALADPNDPLPVRAAVAFDPAGAVNARVVLTNQQNALLVYTSNTPPESVWDGSFAEAMSRRLANPLAMALAGRPDFARELLMESQQFAGMALENSEL